MLIHSKHLYQESETNNAIFPIYNEHNICVGAEVHGTLSDIRFKGVKQNSMPGYGFNVRVPDNHAQCFDYALFFESAIDLLSFIDIKLRHENKTLERCILTSMSGLKSNVIYNIHHVFSTPSKSLTCVLCTDNDNAAFNFRESVASTGIKYIDQRPIYPYKDFNDQLLAIKRK
jgi:hypothetical protein